MNRSAADPADWSGGACWAGVDGASAEVIWPIRAERWWVIDRGAIDATSSNR